MKTIKGPAIFLAQFAGDAAPFNDLSAIARWAAGLGYRGLQIPSWDKRLFDLDRAAESDVYCQEIRGKLSDAGIALTELSTHLQGQLVAVHPAYDDRVRCLRAGRGSRQSVGAAGMGGRPVDEGSASLAPAGS